MSNPHYIRILITHQPTESVILKILERRREGLQKAKDFAKSIGATAYRLNFEDRPFAFDDFASPPDKTLWKRHPKGGFQIRETGSKASFAKRCELMEAIQDIQVPGPRTLTTELTGDLFALFHGISAYYLSLDDLGETAPDRFIISWPVAQKGDPIPEYAEAWGKILKESQYHELMENAEATTQK